MEYKKCMEIMSPHFTLVHLHSGTSFKELSVIEIASSRLISLRVRVRVLILLVVVVVVVVGGGGGGG